MKKMFYILIIIINLYLLILCLIPDIIQIYILINFGKRGIIGYNGPEFNFFDFFKGENLHFASGITFLMLLVNIFIICIFIYKIKLKSKKMNVIFKFSLVLYLILNIISSWGMLILFYTS
jgi:hypothetical protein